MKRDVNESLLAYNFSVIVKSYGDRKTEELPTNFDSINFWHNIPHWIFVRPILKIAFYVCTRFSLGMSLSNFKLTVATLFVRQMVTIKAAAQSVWRRHKQPKTIAVLLVKFHFTVGKEQSENKNKQTKAGQMQQRYCNEWWWTGSTRECRSAKRIHTFVEYCVIMKCNCKPGHIWIMWQVFTLS